MYGKASLYGSHLHGGLEPDTVEHHRGAARPQGSFDAVADSQRRLAVVRQDADISANLLRYLHDGRKLL